MPTRVPRRTPAFFRINIQKSSPPLPHFSCFWGYSLWDSSSQIYGRNNHDNKDDNNQDNNDDNNDNNNDNTAETIEAALLIKEAAWKVVEASHKVRAAKLTKTLEAARVAAQIQCKRYLTGAAKQDIELEKLPR